MGFIPICQFKCQYHRKHRKPIKDLVYTVNGSHAFKKVCHGSISCTVFKFWCYINQCSGHDIKRPGKYCM